MSEHIVTTPKLNRLWQNGILPIKEAAAAAQASGFSTFDETSTYKKGAIRIHEGTLYVCNKDINTAKAWSESDWDATELEALIGTATVLTKAAYEALPATKNADGKIYVVSDYYE